MEEFEKWLEKNPYSKSIAPEIAKLAWKAALKWVLKDLEEQYERTAQGDTGWQGKFIEEELGKP